LEDEELVNCIVWDTDSLRPEVQKFFESRKIKQISKNKQSDLNKCIYYSLEKISEMAGNEYNGGDSKKFSIFILGACCERIDSILSILYNVHQYYNSSYSNNTEFYIISKYSICAFLKNGVNYITPSLKWTNPELGYSIICMQEGVQIVTAEMNNNKQITSTKKILKFGEVLFQKHFRGDHLKICVDGISTGFLLYCCTTIYSSNNC
jgi:thiamine pyrophosphokinase